jgi:hypothetical protein
MAAAGQWQEGYGRNAQNRSQDQGDSGPLSEITMSEYLHEAVVGQTRRPEPVGQTRRPEPGEQWTGRQPSPPGVNVK